MKDLLSVLKSVDVVGLMALEPHHAAGSIIVVIVVLEHSLLTDYFVYWNIPYPLNVLY